MNLEEVVEAAAYERPGYKLVAFKEAALPVYLLTARVVTLERKPISPLEEACLKSVDAGLDTPGNICSFLGLPMQVLKAVLANLNSREQINYLRPVGAQSARVLITAKGKAAIDQAAIIQPEERIVPITFDPLLRKVVLFPRAALFKPKDTKEKGWLEIPLCGAKRPEAEDIPLADIDKTIRRAGKESYDIRELLSIRRIERRELLFAPCVALFYRSNGGNDVQIGFYREDGPSIEHEIAFAAANGPVAIGALHALEPPIVPVLDDAPALKKEFEETASEVEVLEESIRAAAAPSSERPAVPSVSASAGAPASIADLLRGEAARAKERLSVLTQRMVQCHEHPKLLREAITKSRERLLIVSPWIRHQVVDRVFVSCLEALLRNGVDVYVGYGLQDEGGVGSKTPITSQARDELEALEKRFDNFTWKFVGNTHRKLLVSDARFAVITSFNWLSFKGDPKDKARDEFGFRVTDLETINAIFENGVRLIREGYDHPRNPRDETRPGKNHTRGQRI